MGSGSGRGRGEPASSRRFFDIFMQSKVGREGGWEVGRGWYGGREEREKGEGRNERGDCDIIQIITQTTVSVVVFIRRENQEMNPLQNGYISIRLNHSVAKRHSKWQNDNSSSSVGSPTSMASSKVSTRT